MIDFEYIKRHQSNLHCYIKFMRQLKALHFSFLIFGILLFNILKKSWEMCCRLI